MRKHLLLTICLSVIMTPAFGATSKPSPLPTIKAPVKSSAKPALKSGTTTPKKTYKHYVRKNVKPIPSPSPKWPPANFTKSDPGSSYAKVPSAEELKSYASNSKEFSTSLQDCEKFVCGAVFVGSSDGCVVWEVNSIITGPARNNSGSRETYGTMHTVAKGTVSKKIVALLLKSTEPIGQAIRVEHISPACWTSGGPTGSYGTTYTPIAGSASTATH